MAHSYAPFLVKRAFEQVKLDFSHQGLPGVLVSVGASYDASEEGRTHQAPGDVALLDTLRDWRVLVPGHPAETEGMLRWAVPSGERVYLRLAEGINERFGPSPAPVTPEGVAIVREAPPGAPLVLAIGPLLDNVLAATEGLSVAVGHVTTVRPFPMRLLAEQAGTDVVLVEPYLAGTSAAAATEALSSRPHRICSLGVGEVDLHRYGTWQEHERAHGLDAAGLATSIRGFLQGAGSSPNSGRPV